MLVGKDLVAAHLAALDPDADRARDRLEREIGPDLATLLVAALTRRSARVSVTRPRVAAA